MAGVARLFGVYCLDDCAQPGGVAPAGSKLARLTLDDPGAYVPREGFEVRPDDGSPVWEPGSAVPASVTNFQARAVLMAMPSPTGTAGRSLFQDVNEILQGEGGVSWQAWEQANEFTRQGALVRSLAARLGLSDTQLDALFITAAGVEA